MFRNNYSVIPGSCLPNAFFFRMKTLLFRRASPVINVCIMKIMAKYHNQGRQCCWKQSRIEAQKWSVYSVVMFSIKICWFIRVNMCICQDSFFSSRCLSLMCVSSVWCVHVCKRTFSLFSPLANGWAQDYLPTHFLISFLHFFVNTLTACVRGYLWLSSF